MDIHNCGGFGAFGFPYSCGCVSAVDKLKFMGRPPDHPWWKTGSPESFLCYPNYFDSSLKGICFSVINTKFACFMFNHVPTYRELGRPSGDFGGHVGSPKQVMGRIWRLGDLLPTALLCVFGLPIYLMMIVRIRVYFYLIVIIKSHCLGLGHYETVVCAASFYILINY